MKTLFLTGLCLMSAGLSHAAAFGFENIADNAAVGDTYAAALGIHFTNATVAMQGTSLSPLFPPAEGTKVAIDDPTAPMGIIFDKTTLEFSARFTWSFPLHFLVAYGNGLVQTINSTDAGQYGPITGTANFIGADVVGGQTNPNRQFFFSNASGIEFISIYSDVPGDSFTIDEVVVTQTPEPGTFGAISIAVALAAALRARHRLRSRA